MQVPHCYSAERVILLRRNLVSVQCVTTRSIPSSPCVVFSIAFACSEFNLRSACRKKKTSFLFRAGLANLSISPSWNTHFCLHCKVLSSISYILDPLFGDEHINMFAQQFRSGFAMLYTLPWTCQNKKRSVTFSLKCWVGWGNVYTLIPNQRNFACKKRKFQPLKLVSQKPPIPVCGLRNFL